MFERPENISWTSCAWLHMENPVNRKWFSLIGKNNFKMVKNDFCPISVVSFKRGRRCFQRKLENCFGFSLWGPEQCSSFRRETRTLTRAVLWFLIGNQIRSLLSQFFKIHPNTGNKPIFWKMIHFSEIIFLLFKRNLNDTKKILCDIFNRDGINKNILNSWNPDIRIMLHSLSQIF